MYALGPEALEVLRSFGTDGWPDAARTFNNEHDQLVDKYRLRREELKIQVHLNDDLELAFTPGPHNELQVEVLEQFLPRFCANASVVYVGDAANRVLHRDTELLGQLGFTITKHEKLPDVVLYDDEQGHLFLIEAVTAHGPVTPKRFHELEEALENCPVQRIYVTAFRDFREFKKHIEHIMWDTEVWVSERPGHLIHFNGPQFFTVYGGSGGTDGG